MASRGDSKIPKALKVRRVLVLAPRVALADQLRSDIKWRFWQHLGFPAVKNTTYVASADDAGVRADQIVRTVHEAQWLQ